MEVLGGFSNIILWFQLIRYEKNREATLFLLRIRRISTECSHNIDKRGQQAASDCPDPPHFWRDETWPDTVQACFCSLRKACLLACPFGCQSMWMTVRLVCFSSSSPSSIFYMGLWRWQKWITYVVESFWQRLCVSKYKRLALPFLLYPFLTHSHFPCLSPLCTPNTTTNPVPDILRQCVDPVGFVN